MPFDASLAARAVVHKSDSKHRVLKMIQIRRSQDRGHADHGWLDSYHTFSFASYRDPEFTHFETLRVINQDRVEPGQGFETHGHQDMEIVSYVLDGILEHKDSMGNGSQMRPGEVQLMSAGTGVTHSEFNASASKPLHFLQMWVFPKNRGTTPRYEQKQFAPEQRQGKLRLVVSPDGSDGSLTIGQDAWMYAGYLAPGETTEKAIPEGRVAWLHVAAGAIQLGDIALQTGDAAAIRAEQSISLTGIDAADVLVWELTPIAGK